MPADKPGSGHIVGVSGEPGATHDDRHRLGSILETRVHIHLGYCDIELLELLMTNVSGSNF